MGEYSSNLQTRFRLEEAKFFFRQMEVNFQDRTKFLYCLDAFLASARSVTLVFKKEFHDDKSLMNWYKTKVEEWKNNKVMTLFIEMRNISIHEHTPKMKVTHAISITADAILVDSVTVRKISPDGTIEQVEAPPREPVKPSKEKEKIAPSPRTVRYSFHDLPKWFDENPDVMELCKAYLDELERFVTEAENVVKKGQP
jgi:hypothetical protein